MRRVAVGSQEQNALGHVIESTDIREAGHVVDQIKHGAASRRIGARCQHTGGLVENDPKRCNGRAHRFTINGDLVVPSVDALPDRRDNSIYAHATGGNQLLSPAT